MGHTQSQDIERTNTHTHTHMRTPTRTQTAQNTLARSVYICLSLQRFVSSRRYEITNEVRGHEGYLKQKHKPKKSDNL